VAALHWDEDIQNTGTQATKQKKKSDMLADVPGQD
jgi:hypothetical protein